MLNEKEVRKIIKSNKKVIVKVWDDNCPYCKEYESIFDAAAAQYKDSTFVAMKIPRNEKENKFRNEFLQGDGGVPKTLIFENGELKSVGHGRMFAEGLAKFIETGVQERKAPNPMEWAANASYTHLKEAVKDHHKNIRKLTHTRNIFEEEVRRRDRLKKKAAKSAKAEECRDKICLSSFFSLNAWLNPCPVCKQIRILLGISAVIAGFLIYYFN